FDIGNMNDTNMGEHRGSRVLVKEIKNSNGKRKLRSGWAVCGLWWRNWAKLCWFDSKW
ncbi:unnamed protein product, partial [Durusdinium trenchii]